MADDSISIDEQVREIAERIAGDYGLELVHVEIARSGGRGDAIVRIFIDKPSGVTHEDCAHVSEHVGAILEAEDLIPSAYTLEVSSPGLERGLYKLADYARFAGALAAIKTAKPLGNQKNFRGRIAGIDGEIIKFEDKTSGAVEIPFAIIAKAHLEIDTEAEFRRAKELEKQRAETNGQHD